MNKFTKPDSAITKPDSATLFSVLAKHYENTRIQIYKKILLPKT